MIFTEENKQNVEDIKQLNQINLAEILPEKEIAANEESKEEVKSAATVGESATQQTKIDYLDQIRQAREKAATVEFKFAEEDDIKKFEEEKK